MTGARRVAVGLFRTRALGAVSALVGIVLLIEWFAWSAQFVVSVRFGNQGRGLGAFEMAAMVLAAILPPLRSSRIGARQRLVHGFPRLLDTTTTLTVICLPLLCMPVWLASAQLHQPEEYPSGWGYAGTILCISVLGQAAYVLGGLLASLIGTPSLWVAVMCLQQAYPDLVPLQGLARGNHWHTAPLITIFALIAAIAIAWFGKGLPHSTR